MTTANYPPQAYTREVLTQAFNWLRTQPQSVKDRALTADSLVSLYLHARRQEHLGSWESEAPVSSENFKSDLKNLAQGLREFENFTPPVEAKPSEVKQSEAKPQETFQAATTHHQVEQETRVSTTSTRVTAKVTASGVQFDEKTLETLRKVRARLNLSSEAEAARMLIVLGAERLNRVLPLDEDV